MTHTSAHIRLLHTSDWHLGRSLYGRKRYDEFRSFLDWLAGTVKKESVRVLLVAGDVFDSATPSNRFQELYYRFLCRVAEEACRHVVIIGGNHDSPSFLQAPKELLKFMDVHVIGKASENPMDEVLVLKAPDGSPEMIVCAVPYLRDSDIRRADPGETFREKELKTAQGTEDHYRRAAEAAEAVRSGFGGDIPVVAMGHLFAAGGTTVDGDGVRELCVGSLASVDPSIFSRTFDYVALGHLHVPQRVQGSETVRYSGSPIPMGFGEAVGRKSLCLVDFVGRDPSVRLLPVPVFQPLERIRGDLSRIAKRLWEISTEGSRPWLEVIYDGEEVLGGLRDLVEKDLPDGAELLRLKDGRIISNFLETQENVALEDLDHYTVFQKLLDSRKVPEEGRAELMDSYREIVSSMQEEDPMAE